MTWASIFTWIPTNNQHNLASTWGQLKLFNGWGTSSFPRLCLRFSIMNPHFITSENTVQKLIFIMVKKPQMFFVMVTLDAFWSSVSCFDTHQVLTVLISILGKIWSADALPMLNWLPTSCNVTLWSLLTKSSTFATILGVTVSAGLPGKAMSFMHVLPSRNVKPSHKRLNGICRL